MLWGSSINIVSKPMGWTAGVQFSTGLWISILRHRIQTESGANKTSCPMDTGGSFPEDNGAWSWLLILYLHSRISAYGMVIN